MGIIAECKCIVCSAKRMTLWSFKLSPVDMCYGHSNTLLLGHSNTLLFYHSNTLLLGHSNTLFLGHSNILLPG